MNVDDDITSVPFLSIPFIYSVLVPYEGARISEPWLEHEALFHTVLFHEYEHVIAVPHDMYGFHEEIVPVFIGVRMETLRSGVRVVYVYMEPEYVTAASLVPSEEEVMEDQL